MFQSNYEPFVMSEVLFTCSKDYGTGSLLVLELNGFLYLNRLGVRSCAVCSLIRLNLSMAEAESWACRPGSSR